MSRSAESGKADCRSQLNAHATPFVPAASIESSNERKDSERKQSSGDTECIEIADDRYVDDDEYDLLPDSLSLDVFYTDDSLNNVIPPDDGSSPKAAEIADDRVFDPSSEYVGSGSDAHHLPDVVGRLSCMFPNVSDDFIVDALKLQEFDLHLTIDMLSHLCEVDGHGNSAEAKCQL